MMRLSEKCRLALLLTVDSFLALFVFFPSLISYWRGIWDLLGVYIFPDREPLNHWTTAAIGAMSVFGYFILPWLKKTLQPLRKAKKRSNRILFYVATRLYMYLYAAFYMTYWRGLWSLGDFYMLAHGWKGDVTMLIVLYAVLSVLRCSRTIIFPPYVVTLDTRDSLMEASTRFGMKPHEPAKYMLDCVMTHFIIIPLAILTWRSAWATVGAFLFPDDPWFSDVIALAIGASSTILLFAFQAPLAKISRHLEEKGYNLRKLLYEDFVYLITTLCQFFIWRGGWNLNSRYLLSDPLLGGWVNHVVGTFLLMALQLFSYVSACGCAVDGFDPRGKAIYPIRYLRHYLRHHKKAKNEKAPIRNDPAQRVDKEIRVQLTEKLPDGRATSATDEENNSVAESSFDAKLVLSETSAKATENEECESLMTARADECDLEL